MRSDARWSLCLVAIVAVVGVAVGCSGSDATDDESATSPQPADAERVACERVQDLVDAVVAGEALSAMTGLTDMEQALADSRNPTLESNGREFFETISGTVPNPGDLTIQESAAVGDRALATAQPRLQALLDECGRLGLPIQNLPTSAGRP